MTDIGGLEEPKEDPFAQYVRQGSPSQRALIAAWQAGIGLQAVDGLEPSPYLITTARSSIEGEITLDEAQSLVNSYYQQNPQRGLDRTEEADKVATRVAQVLSEDGFVFSAAQYLAIHRRLFTGIYPQAGKVRTYNISKKEWVLSGDTVTYGNAADLMATLEYDLALEHEFSYRGLNATEIIEHLASFVARLWQIHLFDEGNTRTTAVFFIKYLRTLGFTVDNTLFSKHAWYFRNAMVRANYENLAAGIHETNEYLVKFLRNLLLGEENELKNRYLHISGLVSTAENQAFESDGQEGFPETQDIISSDNGTLPEKQDIEVKKQDIRLENQDIEWKGLSPVSARHAQKLYDSFGDEGVFSRSQVTEILGITPSPASELLRKLLAASLIIKVKGKGKGKYRFS
ncbi:Fic family protein [uncultured Varibaculum sp.]|uniref:Fic family protein n=1 Tax=uncultured Varibaculum sp. TaxID=413896 RepID=UPI00258D95E2|nr:Fic family protein [uncultured Varibaculum sp.]